MAVMFSSAFLFSTYFHRSCIFHSTERENGFCEVLRSQVSFGSPRLPPSLGHRNEVPFFCWFTKSSGKVKLRLLPPPQTSPCVPFWAPTSETQSLGLLFEPFLLILQWITDSADTNYVWRTSSLSILIHLPRPSHLREVKIIIFFPLIALFWVKKSLVH